jgi:hypothetical protein
MVEEIVTPKERALDLFNTCYFVLFNSDTECSEECTVSILSIENAKVIARAIISEYETMAIKLDQPKFVMEMLEFYGKVIECLDEM